MADNRKLGIYLNDGMRQDVAAGRHNFFNMAISAFENIGFSIAFYPNSEEERQLSEQRDGYSLFHLETPTHNRALDVRLACFYPFWRIEKAQWREDYRIALKEFDPTAIDGEAARKFVTRWRKRHNARTGGDTGGMGKVFVALQGRLTDRRHGQSMTPIEMITSVLKNDRFRQILLRPHPNEDYGVEEMNALSRFKSNPRIEFSEGELFADLRLCDYIVTQNSTVALKGLALNKPSVLFGRADFHHIFENVHDVGEDRAFRDILSKSRSYAKYFYWFFQLNTINAGRPEAPDQILQNCRDLGWDV